MTDRVDILLLTTGTRRLHLDLAPRRHPQLPAALCHCNHYKHLPISHFRTSLVTKNTDKLCQFTQYPCELYKKPLVTSVSGIGYHLHCFTL